MRFPLIAFRAFGPLALFCHPHFRAEPYSYDVPTPSVGTGIAENLYSKPEFEIEIARIYLQARIRRTDWMGHAIDAPNQSQSLLRNVDYGFVARIVPNPLRANPAHNYHAEFLSRMRKFKQFKQPYFGRREFVAFWEPVKDESAFRPIAETRPLGRMLFDLLPRSARPDDLDPLWFDAALEKGVVHVPESLYAKHRQHRWEVRNQRSRPARTSYRWNDEEEEG